MTRRITLVLLAFFLLPIATRAAAQTTQWDPTQIQLTRDSLQRLQAQYEQTASSTAYSSALREQARRNAQLIETRLREGDFQTGDQIALVVEGEEALTHNFVVEDGPALVLPTIGKIPLAGVRIAEA